MTPKHSLHDRVTVNVADCLSFVFSMWVHMPHHTLCCMCCWFLQPVWVYLYYIYADLNQKLLVNMNPKSVFYVSYTHKTLKHGQGHQARYELAGPKG